MFAPEVTRGHRSARRPLSICLCDIRMFYVAEVFIPLRIRVPEGHVTKLDVRVAVDLEPSEGLSYVDYL